MFCSLEKVDVVFVLEIVDWGYRRYFQANTFHRAPRSLIFKHTHPHLSSPLPLVIHSYMYVQCDGDGGEGEKARRVGAGSIFIEEQLGRSWGIPPPSEACVCALCVLCVCSACALCALCAPMLCAHTCAPTLSSTASRRVSRLPGNGFSGTQRTWI